MLRKIILVVVVAFLSNEYSYAIYTYDGQGKNGQTSAAQTEKAIHSRGTADAILWQEPVDLEQRDLFYGRGGKEGAPNPAAKYTFIRRSTTGTSKKIIVKDDKGREWTVKFGREARPETTSTRIVWAVGYHVDQDYFVKHAHISGWGDVKDVRFERREEGFEEVGTWSWTSNPFNDSRELQGLKVLLIALLKNWDLKTEDNEILRRKTGNASNKHIYYVSDLGGTLGATGSLINRLRFLSDLPPDRPFRRGRGKGNAKAFSQEGFIQEVREDGSVKFRHIRKRGRRILQGVTVDSARWMGNLLSRLSEKQLRDAFRAGNFSDSEIAIYLKTLRERIHQLKTLGEETDVATPASRAN